MRGEVANGGKHPDLRSNISDLDGVLYRQLKNASLFHKKPDSKHEDAPFLDIAQFTPEDRRKLEDSGLITLPLTRTSIKTEIETGKPFWTRWHKDYPDFEALPSLASEIAINPVQPHLLNSNNLPLADQIEMVSTYSTELQQKLKTKTLLAIMGSASDYVELSFAYLARTGIYLFGQDFDYSFARTTTPITETTVANVGGFGADSGLIVLHSNKYIGGQGLFAVPLIVPCQPTNGL